MMEKVSPEDGTTIAFDQLGEGAPLDPRRWCVVRPVDRRSRSPTALAAHFTVLNYDRRGRGDSGDTLPFAVDREVEDLDVLLAAAGGSATVVGLSSGAALAAEAALPGCRSTRSSCGSPHSASMPTTCNAGEGVLRRADAPLLADGRKADALAHFMRCVGLPEEMIAGMRQSPYWQLGESLAPTLAYDAAVMGGGRIPADGTAGSPYPRSFLPARRARISSGRRRPRSRRRSPARTMRSSTGRTTTSPAKRSPRPWSSSARADADHDQRSRLGVRVGPRPRRGSRLLRRQARLRRQPRHGAATAFRWLVVHAPAQPEVPIMLVVPGPPAVEEGDRRAAPFVGRHRLPRAWRPRDG